MQDGTQTFLEYVININLENKPTNLKFYYDIDKKEEITVDENKITLNGFITWHGSQLRDEIIYWEWPYQTGETETEIRNNDIDDSSFMNKIMRMRIGVVGRQAKEPTTDMYATKGVVGRYEAVHNTVDGYDVNSTTWYDVSGNGNTGTIHNATFGNNYLEFNGENSWVDLGEMNSDNQTIEVTFSSNIDINSVTYLIGNWQTGGGGIATRDTGLIYGEFWFDSLNGYSAITTKEKINKGEIYNVLLTYNGTLEIMYVNGVEIGRKERSEPIKRPLRSTVMAIGANPDGNSAINGYFNGKIYSAAVYNRALTEREVANNAHIALSFANGN